MKISKETNIGYVVITGALLTCAVFGKVSFYSLLMPIIGYSYMFVSTVRMEERKLERDMIMRELQYWKTKYETLKNKENGKVAQS